jgi:hypothetical protein
LNIPRVEMEPANNENNGRKQNKEARADNPE